MIEVVTTNKKSVSDAAKFLASLTGAKTTTTTRGRASSKKKQDEEEFEDDDFDTENDDDFGDDDFPEDDFDGEGEDEGDDDFDDEPEEEPAPKRGRGRAAKKPTLKDIQVAFRAYAKANSTTKAMNVLKKFKVKNVQSLKEADYPKVLKIIK